MTAAFKEWAVVVDALGRGDQIFILRKGGIHEGRSGFTVQHPEFLLLPTLFHQQRESVLPTAQARFDVIAPSFPPDGILRLAYWAQLVEWQEISSFEALQRLRGQHVWTDQVLRERFTWGGSENIHALAVRVFRMPCALEIPMLPRYGGCKSWVDLEADVHTAGSEPILDDALFQNRLEAFRDSLLTQAA